MQFIFWFLCTVLSLWLIALILVQRGKGGGLTGALGGMGGQSAFGSKAGDVFTRITVISSILWITCCLLLIRTINPPPAAAVEAEGANISSIEDLDDSGASALGSGETEEVLEGPEFNIPESTTGDSDSSETTESSDETGSSDVQPEGGNEIEPEGGDEVQPEGGDEVEMIEEGVESTEGESAEGESTEGESTEGNESDSDNE